MEIDSIDSKRFRRREAVALMGGLGAGAIAYLTAGPRAIAEALAVQPTATSAASCVLSKEVTEGPYWIDTNLTRRNITEGKKGAALALYVKVIDADTCKPIKGADVEIWHTDAGGVYSGVNGNSKRFLRGHQKSDSGGRVRFDTLYPGWYQGRTPHIHVKVHVGGSEVHTGQIFFTDAASRTVYKTAAYKSRGQSEMTNGEDSIYAQAGRSKATARLTKRGKSGYKGTITLGVNA